MSTNKVAITIEEETLKRVDRLVKSGIFPNRSKAFQKAVEEKLFRIDKYRLARESAKLSKKQEQSLADEGLSIDKEEWPEY